MGDDALRAFTLCMESQDAVLDRLHQELPGLANALKWSRKISG
jgi:hypothetical protein